MYLLPEQDKLETVYSQLHVTDNALRPSGEAQICGAYGTAISSFL